MMKYYILPLLFLFYGYSWANNQTNPLVLTVTLNVTHATCPNYDNGKIVATPSGGVSPYSYLWNNGETSNTISNLQAGSYSLTVTDVNGLSTVKSATVIQNVFNASLSVTKKTNCPNFNDGRAEVINIANGTAPYQYLWSSGQTTALVNNLAAGNFLVTVTDAKGCQLVKTGEIKKNFLTTFIQTLQGGTCLGGNAGKLQFNSMTGGLSPYTYLWSNGATTQTNANLAAGTYTLTATDSRGCQGVATQSITQITPEILVNRVNPSCVGVNNGSISFVSMNTNANPYSFLWSNGMTANSINNLGIGNYSLTVTDANGCSANTNISLDVISISVFLNTVNPSTYCKQDGSISFVSMNTNAPPYSFLWNNGATTSSVTNLAVGAYSLTITDANGCSGIFGANLYTSPPHININVITPTCNGVNNGSISFVSMSTNAAPYTFLWNTGATTSSIMNLAAGNYALTVSDANGCSSTAEPFLFYNLTPTANIDVIKYINCSNATNGEMAFGNMSTNAPPYTFLWNNGATTNKISNLAAGNYSLTVTDAIGCKAIDYKTLNNSSTPSAYINIEKQISSSDGKNGQLGFYYMSTFAPPYTFLWSNGATTSSISNLTAGNYFLTVTDINGCTAISNQYLYSYTTYYAVININKNISCSNANNGELEFNYMSPSVPPYTFLWSNGATTSSISNLAVGNYSLTITDANGCSAVAYKEISLPSYTPSIEVKILQAPDCPSANYSNGELAFDYMNTNSPPYTFQWSNGATTSSISNLLAGLYSLTVTDANNCSATQTVNLQNDNRRWMYISAQQTTCASANNGTVYAFLGGFTPPFNFLWNNGATTQNINNLSSGMYSLTFTDATNCIIKKSVYVNDNIPEVAVSVSNATCPNFSNGELSFIAMNTNSPQHTFLWSNGATTSSITNLSSGTYTLTVTDANNCQAVAQKDISNFNNSGIVLSKLKSPTCGGKNDGELEFGYLTNATAASSYSFLWSNGATTANITNLSDGIYFLTVTASNGCSATGNWQIYSQNNKYAYISGISSPCFGKNNGSIYVSYFSSSATPFTYLWSNGATTDTLKNINAGTYMVTITDANGCKAESSYILYGQNIYIYTRSLKNATCPNYNNGEAAVLYVSSSATPFTYLWSSGATTDTVKNLKDGYYELTVTDANGCVAYDWNIMHKSELQLYVNINQSPSCPDYNNGILKAELYSAGTSSQSFLWSNGATTATVNNLSEGYYIVTATNTAGCIATNNFYLNYQKIVSNIEIKQSPTCPNYDNGKLKVSSINGGVAPYIYLWSNGATTDSIINLSKGTYKVTVTDSRGCNSVGSQTIIDNKPEIQTNITESNCDNASNGEINILGLTNATAPYSFNWSNGATTSSITNQTKGSYLLTVTDAKGCVISDTFNLKDKENYLYIYPSKNPNCSQNDGELYAVTSLASPYSYLWSNGATSSTISNLFKGTYSLTITDILGCSLSKSVVLNNNEPNIYFQVNNYPSCSTSNDGSLSLYFSNYTGNYNIFWNNGATTSTLQNLSSGNYSVTITYGLNCSMIRNFTLNHEYRSISLNTQSAATCPTYRNGAVFVLTNGLNNQNNNYLWSNGATTDYINNLSKGWYYVTVSNSTNNCILKDSIRIDSLYPTLYPYINNHPTCPNTANGSAFVAQNFNETTTFKWSNGITKINDQSINL